MAKSCTSSNGDPSGWKEIERYWLAIKTQEPVPENLKSLVRENLVEDWHFHRVEEFFLRRKLEWTTVDSEKITLGYRFNELDTRTLTRTLQSLCNKPTAFYWLQSAQRIDASGERTLTSSIVFAAIYEEWSRCGEPNIEFGHFFANPIRITPDGPSTIHAIVNAHARLCVHASDFVHKTDGEVSRQYLLQPLYHAIVVLLDQLDLSEVPEINGVISLRQYAQQQNVLLVRTGREDGLTEPISFDSLKPKSLPLQRSDDETAAYDMTRVSLATAVKFVTELESREGPTSVARKRDQSYHDAFLDPMAPQGPKDPRPVCHNAEAWAQAVLDDADEFGFDNIPEAKLSIRRVKAKAVGQEFAPFEHQPVRHRWRY